MFRPGTKIRIAYQLLLKGATIADGLEAGLSVRNDVVRGWYRDVANRLGCELINSKGTYTLGTEAELIAAKRAAVRFDPEVLVPWLEGEFDRTGYVFGARGWCYVLEGRSLITKGEFPKFENWLATVRKKGLLNPDVVSDDETRGTQVREQYIDGSDPDEYALEAKMAGEKAMREARDAAVNYLNSYRPISFWGSVDTYVEVLVEKSDLVTIFQSTCDRYFVAITNAKGSFDVNGRRRMLQRFKEHHEAGRKLVLLYFGDHDPAGLRLSDFLHKNLMDCANIQDVQWDPWPIVVERVGLSEEQIEELGLPWIDNLITSSRKNLNDPKHKDHKKPYVQDYIKKFGVRKVEANALVRDVPAAQRLLRQAINQYVTDDDLRRYGEIIAEHRQKAREAYAKLMAQEEDSRDSEADEGGEDEE